MAERERELWRWQHVVVLGVFSGVAIVLAMILGCGNEGVTDLVALTAVHEHLGVVMTTVELAAALGVTEEEAAARITGLTNEGYLSLPMQVRSEAGEWSAIGVKLTARGRDRLGVE